MRPLLGLCDLWGGYARWGYATSFGVMRPLEDAKQVTSHNVMRPHHRPIRKNSNSEGSAAQQTFGGFEIEIMFLCKTVTIFSRCAWLSNNVMDINPA